MHFRFNTSYSRGCNDKSEMLQEMVCAMGSEAFRFQYDVTTFTTSTLRQSPNVNSSQSRE